MSIYFSENEKRRIKRASTILFYRFPLTQYIVKFVNYAAKKARKVIHSSTQNMKQRKKD